MTSKEINRKNLTTQVKELEAQVYVPGSWQCPKCKFTLLQSNLNANDGTVTARDTPGDKCPNCTGPLWRCTWKGDAFEMQERAVEQMARATKAERDLDTMNDNHRAMAKQLADLGRERDEAYEQTKLLQTTIDSIDGGLCLMLAAVKMGDPQQEIVWRVQEELRQIAKVRALATDSKGEK